MNILEADIQKSIVQYMTIRNVFFFSVPNERKDMRMMNKLKAMGYTSGASDLIIGHKGRMYCMEVKADKGKQSENQKEFMHNAIMAGCEYAVVKTLDSAIDCLKTWGVVT